MNNKDKEVIQAHAIFEDRLKTLDSEGLTLSGNMTIEEIKNHVKDMRKSLIINKASD